MATVKIAFPAGGEPGRITKWRVGMNAMVSAGRVVLHYRSVSVGGEPSKDPEKKLRASKFGRVIKVLANEGDVLQPGQEVLLLEGCKHPTVMKDLCAECGADLREEFAGDDGQNAVTSQASVPMVHSVPELKVCPELAEKIGREDEKRLLQDRKLALLVDLDQTIVHTTNDNVPPDMKDVYHFQLYGPHSPWYHTKLRPGTREFLAKMSRLYELHICTFGARNYAHTVAALLDKDGVLFSHRILSRDECFDPASKTANLKALFPCGDSMVCIIDDREDVWQGCGNLVQVKPYHFFRHTGDIHAPPGLAKRDQFPQLKTTSLDEINEPETRVKVTENGALPNIDCQDFQTLEENSNKQKTEDETKEEKDVIELELQVETAELKPNKINEGEQKEQTVESKAPELGEKLTEPDEVKANNADKDSAIVGEQGPKKEELVSGDPEKLVESGEVKRKAAEEESFKDLEKRQELEDHDDYLLYLEDILRRIHAEFYSKQETDAESNKSLRDIIPRVRGRVLKGLRLTFSGIVATHQKLHQSRAYKVARALGAEVSQDLQDNTTHLVAIKPGTAKVYAAKRMWQVKIVNPDWLWTCAERWECVDERLYPLTKKARGSRVPPPHCSSPDRIDDQETEGGDRFADSINPLMSFTLEEIANMDKEVEEDMSDQELETSAPISQIETSQTQHRRRRSATPDSLNEDCEDEEALTSKRRKIGTLEELDDNSSTEGKKVSDGDEDEDDPDDEDDPLTRFRRGEGSLDGFDLGDDSQDSMEVAATEDDGEWNEMGAALEREFLSE
ncbi:RNA polymerase II subunit A C-terminal domain phosphatase [Neodiprion pinetum]|uniref:RNA polymerase II subunit A C-terminal domain phosphatase n=1 Tax=Neodiprion lecontei TaxID=441921 RepID=A0A6J0B5Z2_NEOLC|nr:RNA polymerase II subunit A C-terminal domain phosphatase [Neodiprion lecontei]XP_046491411.1 RNA polymerase II subunit A C-terminal domain phosphatase [Neodiprion pinetum]